MKNNVPSPALPGGGQKSRTGAAASGPVAAVGISAGVGVDLGARSSRPRFRLARFRDLALLPALLLLIVIGAFVSPSFLTKANMVSILGSSAALAFVVLAESLIILTGKFDLSLESTAACRTACRLWSPRRACRAARSASPA